MNLNYLSNIISARSSLKRPFELLYDERPMFHDNLNIFGKVGVITTKEKIQVKLIKRGTMCIFVRYTYHHSRDLYRMLNFSYKLNN
jgi:hypothetical protein